MQHTIPRIDVKTQIYLLGLEENKMITNNEPPITPKNSIRRPNHSRFANKDKPI
jgi:hypothetical protein